MSIEEEKLTGGTAVPGAMGTAVPLAASPTSAAGQAEPDDRAAERIERLSNAFTVAQTGVSNPDIYTSSHQHRTRGLKIFDAFLYPFLTNFGVFFTSVVATYLTSHGDKTGGQLGKFFFKRGQWLTNQMTTKLHWSPGTADMAKMVTFSFLDGSLMAPLVKMLEDRREKFARRIDAVLGTKPADDSVYAAEPKQSWLSVLGGRLGVVSIVVPTAVALDKTGLNDKLFSEPGRKTGEWIARNPDIAKPFGKLDIPGLFKTTFFEFFYTSVCTTGLYFSSRFIAKLKSKHSGEQNVPQPVPVAATAASSDDAQAKNPAQEETQIEGKFTNAVGRKDTAPKEKPASQVQRYEQDAASASPSTAIH